jgi:ethanolamine utilization protein EutJ
VDSEFYEEKILPVDRYLMAAEKCISPCNTTIGTTTHINNNYRVGVDLGTAYLVLVVLDQNNQPIAGEYCYAEVVRDGVVVDYIGAIDLLKKMKSRVERHLDTILCHAASAFPPGIARAEVQSTANVLEAAGFICSGLIDEPSAANNVLDLQDGAVVDIGGGTTGIAIIKNGKVVYSADEPTGGTHFSLVIAGALGISFEEAEELKKDAAEQKRLFPTVRPVMEKVGNIITRHVDGKDVDRLTLVGGSSIFPGIADVIQEYTTLPTHVPSRPLFVTPLGIALHDQYLDR